MEKFKVGDWVRHKSFKKAKLIVVSVNEENNDAEKIKYECRQEKDGVIYTSNLYGFELIKDQATKQGSIPDVTING